MARINIQGGLERDEFYDRNDALIGVAEYDLNDAGVRLRVLEFANSMEARWDKLKADMDAVLGDSGTDKIDRLEAEQARLEAAYQKDDSAENLSALEAVENEIGAMNLKGGLEKTRIELAFADQIVADADAIFGENFCAKAIGVNCRNYFTLMEVLLGIVGKYGAKPNIQMDALVKSTKNREQRRIERKGKRR